MWEWELVVGGQRSRNDTSVCPFSRGVGGLDGAGVVSASLSSSHPPGCRPRVIYVTISDDDDCIGLTNCARMQCIRRSLSLGGWLLFQRASADDVVWIFPVLGLLLCSVSLSLFLAP